MKEIQNIQFETLDPRRLMSVSLHSGELRIFGTSADEQLSVRVKLDQAGLLQVNDNGILKAFISSKVNRIAIIGRDGNDTITVDPSIRVPTSLNGGEGNDTIRGGSGADMIVGSNGNDVEFGGKGADAIDGAAGDDALDAGVDTDRDVLEGGSGADALTNVGPEDGAANVTGDSVSGNFSQNLKNVSLDHGVLNVNEGAGDDSVYITLWTFDPTKIIVRTNGFDALFNVADVSGICVRGGGGNDRIDIRPELTIDATLYGGDGDDSLFGGSGADLIVGHAGKDYLTGRDNNDSLSGGAGTNFLTPGEDVDWIDDGHGHFIYDGQALSSVPANHATIEGVAYYLNQYATRSELWRSDGTAAGTVRLAVLSKDTEEHAIVAVESRVVFFSNHKLWSTDGTIAGTFAIPGPGGGAWSYTSSGFESSESLNGRKVFIANGGLFSTDGTTEGTVLLVADVMPHLGFQPMGNFWITQVHNLSTQKYEVYATNGTLAGTQQLASNNLYGGADFSSGASLNGKFIFSTTEAGGATRVYRTDGTAAGTNLIVELSSNSSVNEYLVIGDWLFFVGKTFVTNNGPSQIFNSVLYRSDGTAEGTSVLHNFGMTIGRNNPSSGVYDIKLAESAGMIDATLYQQTYRTSTRPNYLYSTSIVTIDPQI